MPLDRIRVDPARAQILEPDDLGGEVVDVHVEVHPVLGGLRLADLLERDHGLRLVAWEERPELPVATAVLVVERRGPEPGESFGVGAVEGDREPVPHARMLSHAGSSPTRCASSPSA